MPGADCVKERTDQTTSWLIVRVGSRRRAIPLAHVDLLVVLCTARIVPDAMWAALPDGTRP
jgi:hypothetical protein